MSTSIKESKGSVFREGMRDGMPIALGYFAVSFALGIAARNAGLTAFQGFLASLLNNASAGEYAGFLQIAADSTYGGIALITLITNARYLLMSCALSQKFSPETKWYHRLLVGFDVTDEIFGISIARPGRLNPYYNYGAMSLAIPGWAIGTALGIMVGNVLPLRLVSALSVALYGMFLAIIIPPSKGNRVVAGLVAISFASSFALSLLGGVVSFIGNMSDGTKTIVLTVVIAGLAAWFFPIKDEGGTDHDA